MPPSNHDEIKIIAQEVAEHYFKIMKEYVQIEVRLHKAECTVGKFTKVMGVVCAVIGGACVAVFNWFLKKL